MSKRNVVEMNRAAKLRSFLKNYIVLFLNARSVTYILLNIYIIPLFFIFFFVHLLLENICPTRMTNRQTCNLNAQLTKGTRGFKDSDNGQLKRVSELYVVELMIL